MMTKGVSTNNNNNNNQNERKKGNKGKGERKSGRALETQRRVLQTYAAPLNAYLQQVRDGGDGAGMGFAFATAALFWVWYHKDEMRRILLGRSGAGLFEHAAFALGPLYHIDTFTVQNTRAEHGPAVWADFRATSPLYRTHMLGVGPRTPALELRERYTAAVTMKMPGDDGGGVFPPPGAFVDAHPKMDPVAMGGLVRHIRREATRRRRRKSRAGRKTGAIGDDDDHDESPAPPAAAPITIMLPVAMSILSKDQKHVVVFAYDAVQKTVAVFDTGGYLLFPNDNSMDGEEGEEEKHEEALRTIHAFLLVVRHVVTRVLPEAGAPVDRVELSPSLVGFIQPAYCPAVSGGSCVLSSVVYAAAMLATPGGGGGADAVRRAAAAAGSVDVLMAVNDGIRRIAARCVQRHWDGRPGNRAVLSVAELFGEVCG